MGNGSLMEVESIAEGSPWSILQHLWPALSDNQYWKPMFGVLLSDRLRQVLRFSTDVDETGTNIHGLLRSFI